MVTLAGELLMTMDGAVEYGARVVLGEKEVVATSYMKEGRAGVLVYKLFKLCHGRILYELGSFYVKAKRVVLA